MARQYKTTFQTDIKQLEESEGRVTAIFATLNSVDKDGDVTVPGAFGEQEVLIVPSHQWSHVPLGKGRIRERGDKAVADLQLNQELPSAKEWLSALKFDLENGQPLMEWSYGYDVKDSELGEFEGQTVRFLKNLEVHEVSPVLVGAGEGTQTMVAKGAKRAARQHSTETTDQEWDANQAVTRAADDGSLSYYERIFAWVDSENPESKTAHKLPHHEVSQDGTPGVANVRALSAAVAALNGARGGTDIPNSDRRSTYNHLVQHFRDAGFEDGDIPELKEVPGGSVRFADQIVGAKAEVEAVLKRAREIKALRQEEGRDIGKNRKQDIAELNRAVKALSSIGDELDSLLSEEEDRKQDWSHLLAEFERAKATLHGVDVE